MIFSAAIIFGLLLVPNCSTQKREQIKVTQNNYQMFLENESKYNFTETVEKLDEEIEKNGWKVTIIHDLQKTLKKYDTEVLPIKVFALCHPKHASKILIKDDERITSSLMPCRISVYEKSNGKTYISRMNSGIMSKSIGGIAEEVMSDASNEVEEILSPLVVIK